MGFRVGGGHGNGGKGSKGGKGTRGVWDCAACTFHNKSGVACAMCESPRPAEVDKRSGKDHSGRGGGRDGSCGGKGGGGARGSGGGRGRGQSEERHGDEALWSCAVCTFINIASVSMCAMCGVGQQHSATSSAGSKCSRSDTHSGGSSSSGRTPRRPRDASHLLNFQPLPHRQESVMDSAAQPRRQPSRPTSSRRPHEEQTQYMASKLHMLVEPSADYRANVLDPDYPMPWERVRAVRFGFTDQIRCAIHLAHHASPAKLRMHTHTSPARLHPYAHLHAHAHAHAHLPRQAACRSATTAPLPRDSVWTTHTRCPLFGPPSSPCQPTLLTSARPSRVPQAPSVWSSLLSVRTSTVAAISSACRARCVCTRHPRAAAPSAAAPSALCQSPPPSFAPRSSPE